MEKKISDHWYKKKICLGGEKSKHISNESQQIINKTN